MSVVVAALLDPLKNNSERVGLLGRGVLNWGVVVELMHVCLHVAGAHSAHQLLRCRHGRM